MKEALIRLPFARVTWICAIFLLGYVGIEVALGGWIVKFMLEVRDGEEFASGMTATGFWMGVTVGRIVLGFVTPRLGEKLAIAVSVFDTSTPFKLTFHADLPSTHNGPRTYFLARTTILRLRRRRIFSRILPRPTIPRCGRCGY
jgi:hypothetical protein